MLALAAARLGFKSHIFAPEADSPAFDVAAHHSIAAYDDQAALTAFAKSVTFAGGTRRTGSFSMSTCSETCDSFK